MSKMLGFALMILGVIVIALKLVFKQVLDKIPALAKITTLWFVIAGFILIALGFLMMKGKKQAGGEVPIYKGSQIIGYRKV